MLDEGEEPVRPPGDKELKKAGRDWGKYQVTSQSLKRKIKGHLLGGWGVIDRRRLFAGVTGFIGSSAS